MSSSLLAAITAGFMIVSAGQDATPASPANTGAPAQPASAKKICRGIVPTGSIMAKRFCLTKTEWAEFNRMNEDNEETALRKRINIARRPTIE
jgi:hypothetical protein